MRLFTTLLFSIFCMVQVVAQTATYSEIQSNPQGFSSTGANKAWSRTATAPFQYNLNGLSGNSNPLVITDWRFATVPSNAFSILGVEFTINYATATNVSISEVRLVSSNGSSSDVTGAGSFTPATASGSQTFGTPGNLITDWGNIGAGPLSPADISTAAFGVSIIAAKAGGGGSGKIDILSVSMTVYFSALLPVTLSKFDVVRINGDQVAVNWETTSEANVDMLYVERSKDGRYFNTLFEVVPRGKSIGNTLYQVTDKTPISGTSYYRLRERDLDGLNKIYPVQKITINSTVTRFYAKYRQSLIAVDLSGDDGTYHVSLVNLNGQLITRTAVDINGGNAHLDIDASTLKSGMYLVNVYGNGINRTEKVMIAR